MACVGCLGLDGCLEQRVVGYVLLGYAEGGVLAQGQGVALLGVLEGGGVLRRSYEVFGANSSVVADGGLNLYPVVT